jgi:uncharacterized protein with von Willebrand factor type A (vWA) domain
MLVFYQTFWGTNMSEDDFAQQPFNAAEFVENPENRCPVVLVLDNSGSMRGAPIQMTVSRRFGMKCCRTV